MCSQAPQIGADAVHAPRRQREIRRQTVRNMPLVSPVRTTSTVQGPEIFTISCLGRPHLVRFCFCSSRRCQIKLDSLVSCGNRTAAGDDCSELRLVGGCAATGGLVCECINPPFVAQTVVITVLKQRMLRLLPALVSLAWHEARTIH